MAKPYQENGAWAFRLRVAGQDIYRGGFGTRAQAAACERRLRLEVQKLHQKATRSPWNTTVAQALLQYGLDRLGGLKGADQEARRINRFLALAGLPTLAVTPVADQDHVTDRSVVYWTVELVPPHSPRHVPNSLKPYRQRLREAAAQSDQWRERLARTYVADVTPYEVQRFINALRDEGKAAATILLELAPLRQMFTHAIRTWEWPLERGNPARDRDLPRVDNARTRVLTNEEWVEIKQALDATRSPYVELAIDLLLYSAMRCSEALVTARWADLDEERCLLRLRRGKAGRREVPLNPDAMLVMGQLRGLAMAAGPVYPQGRIIQLSYEGLKAAWGRVCGRADVRGVNLHDLRHTSASRYALELNGNVPLLKLVTGHRTTSQLMRYINLSTDQVVRTLHGRELDVGSAPAGYRQPHPAPGRAGASRLPGDAAQPACAAGNVVAFVPRQRRVQGA